MQAPKQLALAQNGEVMKLTIQNPATIPSATRAGRAVEPVTGFGRQMTYGIDTVSMYVNCRCNHGKRRYAGNL